MVIYLSKYNNIKSIAIDTLSKDELKVAIKEWSENNEAMENLLWNCYNNKIETNGCHVGEFSYLSLFVNNDKTKIIKLLDTLQNIKNTKIIITPDGGNPFSGPNWYKPELALCLDEKDINETDEILNLLTDSLNNENDNTKENFFSQLLKLHDFFAYKESGLMFEAIYTKEGTYRFTIYLIDRKNKFEYFNNLFSKAGLIFNTDFKLFDSWKIETKTKEEIIIQTKEQIDIILNKS